MALNPKIKEKIQKKTNGNIEMQKAIINLLQNAEQGKQLKRIIISIDKLIQPI